MGPLDSIASNSAGFSQGILKREGRGSKVRWQTAGARYKVSDVLLHSFGSMSSFVVAKFSDGKGNRGIP
jgi:hypothetical protein